MPCLVLYLKSFFELQLPVVEITSIVLNLCQAVGYLEKVLQVFFAEGAHFCLTAMTPPNYRMGEVLLGYLPLVNLLLYRSSCQKPVNPDSFLLSLSPHSCHCLLIICRIPVCLTQSLSALDLLDNRLPSEQDCTHIDLKLLEYQ